MIYNLKSFLIYIIYKNFLIYILSMGWEVEEVKKRRIINNYEKGYKVILIVLII